MRNRISHEYALKPAELAFGMIGKMGQVVGHILDAATARGALPAA